VKLALLLGVRGRILAREHAHEPHVVRAIAQNLERLHETREPIARDAELRFDLCGRDSGAGILHGRGRRFGGRLGRLGRRFGRLGRRLVRRGVIR
jgi:hypothetical protein